MEIGVYLFLVLHLTCTAVYTGADAQADLMHVKCPTFVVEGEPLDCKCLSKSIDPRCTTQWTHGQSERGPRSLLVPHVTRQNNGTLFTCQMDCNGQKQENHYILQVAYGPSEDSVRVHGPSPFLTDGKSNMTLTCTAEDVNPQPQYKWTNVKCKNLDDNMGKTCTFTPTKYEDGENITCTALNRETLSTAPAVFTLNLTYPPPYIPQLPGYTRRQPVKSGDTIRCTVNGGKPLASDVVFKCSGDVVTEETVERNEIGVTSTLRLNVSESQDVLCNCSAVWEPKPELYPLIVQETITISATTDPGEGGNYQDQKKGDDSKEHSATLGGICGGIVSAIVIIVLVLVFIFRKCKRKTRHKNTERDVKSHQILLLLDAGPQPPVKTNDDPITADLCDSGYSSVVDLKGQCVAAAHASVAASDMSGSCPTVSEMNVRIKLGASKAEYTEVSVDCLEPKLTTDDINHYDVADVAGSKVLERQACSPDSHCQPDPTTPVVNPCTTVNVTDSEYPEHKACCPTSPSEPRLPAPKPCSPTSHFASFGVNSSITRKPGPLGDPYTQVDKKKGCLPIIHEEKSGLLEKISAQDDIYDKLNHAGKSPSPHRFEESPYNRRLSVF